MLFDLKWVAVARHGLKLWENDGTGLKIISRCLPGQKLKIFVFLNLIKNSPHSYQPMAGNMVGVRAGARTGYVIPGRDGIGGLDLARNSSAAAAVAAVRGEGEGGGGRDSKY